VIPTSPDVTGLLARWQRGESGAEEELLPLVYAELRRIAARELRRERPDHTLQPTALVHELYLELRGCGMAWENRTQFFGFAAHVTRRVLVAHARRRGARKRGGDLRRVVLEPAAEPRSEPPSVDLVALDEALDRLSRIDGRLARIVELRYFGGLTLEETAELLGVSAMTVSRGWQRARAWLFDALTAGPGDPACLTTS
jgi:RNA polymerase sigma factor (TIGR02999 family)